jgi:ornithine decarboxylase
MAFTMTTETKSTILQKIAKTRGTPVFIIDIEQVKKNYNRFKENLPEVQVYYAVKANSDPLIVKTLFDMGASFDVASLPEFHLVRKNIINLLPAEQQDFIWERIIYAHPIKMIKTLHELEPYKPLVTYDNFDELDKIKKHCPSAGIVLRLEVPNKGSVVDLSSKFGASTENAVELAVKAFEMGFLVEGLSFHVGSQCTNFNNYKNSLDFAAIVFDEVEKKGYKIRNSKTGKRILDIGGGFPAEEYGENVTPFEETAKKLREEMRKLFPENIEFIAEPGRFLVANACTLVVSIIGRAFRHGEVSYYIDDGIYGTFSGQIFDHQIYPLRAFKEGEKEKCIIFGPTCDGFDTVSPSTNNKKHPCGSLPRMELGEYLYAENMGAYTLASATNFNGFPNAKPVYVNT